MTVTNELLSVQLRGLPQFWALKRRIDAPLAHVRGATDGERHFWDVRSGARAVVIELSDERYRRLVVEVDDPRSVGDTINQAVASAN